MVTVRVMVMIRFMVRDKVRVRAEKPRNISHMITFGRANY